MHVKLDLRAIVIACWLDVKTALAGEAIAKGDVELKLCGCGDDVQQCGGKQNIKHNFGTPAL